MTLTDVSYYLRKFVPFAIIGLVFFVIFYILFKFILGSDFSATTSQKDIPNPEQDRAIYFGKLTKLNPSTRVPYPPGYEFILDTIEGKPITATSSAKIFFLKQKPTRFGYLQTAYRMAKTLKFDTVATKHYLEGTNVIFEDSEKKVAIDIADFNFEYKYNYENKPELFENPKLPTEPVIIENARQLLRQLLKYPTELSLGSYEVIYLKYDIANNTFEVVSSAKEANAAEVDFFRSDIDDLPVKSPRYFNSQNYVVMAFNDKKQEVIKSQVKFYEKDAEHYGFYPIKSADVAYQQLLDGKGLIVSAGNNSSQITIYKMFLGYYDPDIYQEYLQPVYIFLGENNFAAYVPAVLDEFVE